jgi:hypothetical protein
MNRYLIAHRSSFIVTKGLRLIATLIVFSLSLIVAHAQRPDSSITSADKAKKIFQGVWANLNETQFFLFKGDSVKEWEIEGADSSQKPYCSYTVSRIACDSESAHVDSASGLFLNIVCGSEDYQQIRCFFIKSITEGDFKIGFKGEFDADNGEYRKKLKK